MASKLLMRDPATASSRIYVGSLSEQTTEAQLQELFAKYGNIRGVLVSKNYGFVQFETEESAKNAIQNENQQTFLNKKLIVRAAQKNPTSGGGAGAGSGAGAGAGGSSGGGNTATGSGNDNARNNPSNNNSNLNNSNSGNNNNARGGNAGGNSGGGNNSSNSGGGNQKSLDSSAGFGLPLFGGGARPPADRNARWMHGQNRNSNFDKANDNGRDRSPLNDHRGMYYLDFNENWMLSFDANITGGGGGGRYSDGNRPFPQHDRFRSGPQSQRGLSSMQDHKPNDANDCEIVVTSRHLT